LYVPLRTHGHHSLLTGVDAPAQLLARAGELKLSALALTDVDTVAGVVDLIAAGERCGVRPILGAEISDPSSAPGRLLAIARSEEGYRNLCRLVSARQLGDDPGQPGAALEGPEDFDLVGAALRFREGLTYLVDHPRLVFALAGRIEATRLLVAISPAALDRRARVPVERATPGEERNVYVAPPRARGMRRPLDVLDDVEEHALAEQKVPPPARPVPALDLVEAARAAGLATVAVPDTYYALPSGLEDHRTRVAIKHNALLCDLPESWLASAPAHLLSGPEMAALYADLPEVRGPFPAAPAGTLGCLHRTLEIAADCDYLPPVGEVFFPEVELDDDETAYSKLCELAFAGARRRYRPLRPEVVRRLDYELTSIDELGYAPYFLLVRRISDFARDERIPYVGRGSAADSLVAYCLELTDADPLRYKLPFERFLNPSRRDRPDIDLDFCWRRRDEVIEFVYRDFGPERTAMISTLNSFGLRSAFREAALVQGIPPAEVSRWSKKLPWHIGGSAEAFDGTVSEEEPDVPEERGRTTDGARTNPIALALAATPECRDFPFDDPRFESAIRTAGNLLETPRHFGLHPGGVVVSPGPITNWIACQRSAKGVVVTQLDKDGVEAIGLVKMDLLGNRALTVVDDCRQKLAKLGVDVDLAAIPEDDPATAATLARGETLGCFQVESPGMRNLLKQTRSRNMDDVIQAVALIRPGPAGSGMKDAYVRRLRGMEPVRAPHPRLSELLWDTRGIMLYQEDVMQAAAVMAGMDLAEADGLRRSLKGRRGPELERWHRRFLEGSEENGIGREESSPVWELIANFTSFGFCKAHAVTYGRIAYRTVYLKTHWPAAYLVAFLESETGYYQTRVYIEEARRLGVAILPPDVNRSERSFSLESVEGRAALRIGLNRVKGLSERALDAVFEARTQRAFVSLPDFLERTRAHTDEVENLIQVGAFDTFDRTRPELMWRLHLLRAPVRKPPRGSTRREYGDLDAGLLAACRETPDSREREHLGSGESSGGWGQRGMAVGNTLPPGGEASLFPAPQAPALALPRLPDLDPERRALLEFELLGLTVQMHPSRLFPCDADQRLTKHAPETVPCRELDAHAGDRCMLRGWLSASRRVRTHDDRWMRFLTLEDESGIAEVVLFPDIYERDGHRLVERGPFRISGTVEDHMGAVTLHADRIW